MPVWHVARAPEGAVFIGRPSRWGNPFRLRPDEPRGATIERYRRWLWDQLRSGAIRLDELAALHGRDLACYCKPKPCHGDVLADAAAWAHKLLTEAEGGEGPGLPGV